MLNYQGANKANQRVISIISKYIKYLYEQNPKITKQELIQIRDFHKDFCKKYPNHRHCEMIEYIIESDQKQIDSYPNIDY